MTALAVVVLVLWFTLAGALAQGRGTTKGFHVLLPCVASIALAIAVLVH